ncbi:hypothetical protein [Streptacidiphilus melanogenes]|uniref:hypothetical protein n=1 Tax=Streptacidiphilus melanogenes TaxID=411235 RepID=UPI001F32C5A6|nr:hypothetical protein [Streptacidiphilus melanogenes]
MADQARHGSVAGGLQRAASCEFGSGLFVLGLADVGEIKNGDDRHGTLRIGREGDATWPAKRIDPPTLRDLGTPPPKETVTSPYAPPLPDLVPVLRRVVTEVDHDLGFRFLLRVLKAYFMPISEARCERLLTIGEQFGYHELLVDENLNVSPDPAD